MSKIFKVFSKNKKTLILIIGLGLFLSLAPLHSAEAIVAKFIDCRGPIWDVIACWIKGVFDTLALLPVYMLIAPVIGSLVIYSFLGVFISFIFYASASILLNWVVSPSFVSLSLTQATNPIINAGWTFTSGLVNLSFVLILVFIALATILRLETYGMKKLLPKFLLVILLVNFSLVICGAIVDVAHVVQNSFFGGIRNIGNDFINVFFRNIPIIGTFYSGLTGTAGECKLGEPFWCALDAVAQSFLSLSGLLGMLIKAFSATFFGLFAGFVILLYVLLFMIRIIVLWFLAILAPVAWVCWVLPFTQKIFRTWWSYFLQWAFVGAIAGFFLCLSKVVISQLDRLTPAMTVPPNDILQTLLSPLTTVLTGLFAFGAVIAFLIIGFIISIKTAGGGTEAVLKWGESGLKAAGAWAGRRGLAAVRERIPEGVRRRAERMAIAPTRWGEGVGGFRGMMMRTMAAPYGAARRGVGGAILRATTEAEEDVAKKAGEGAKNRDVMGNLSAFRQATSRAEEREILSTMIDLKQDKDALDEHVVGPGNTLTPDEIIRPYENAKRRRKVEVAEKFERSFVNRTLPDGTPLINQFAAITDQATATLGPADQTGTVAGRPSGLDARDIGKYYTSFEEKIIGESKTADEIRQLQKGWWDNAKLMEAAHKFWGGNQVGEAARTFGRSFTERFQATAHNIEWYFETDTATGRMGNPMIPRYLASSAAQGLGLTPLSGGETMRDINRLTQAARALAAPPPRPPPPPITPAEERQMVNDINNRERRLRELRRRPARTTAEEVEIRRLEGEIQNLKRRLGRL